jgi:phosphoribosyl-AMP cyclohydrolase
MHTSIFQLFDDVVRKFRESEALVPVYRNQTAIEQTVRKSLAEVYEEKFAEELNKDGEGTSQVYNKRIIFEKLDK